jgi:midasin
MRPKEEKGCFSWKNGPLVEAMMDGGVFLLDEISLAEDSVLERLNSVLEPSRMLLLAENSHANEKEIVGTNGFQFCSTMNPGGDFGKKELSPALRNRFTEIWVPSIMENRNDLEKIVLRRMENVFGDQKAFIGKAILDFIDWYRAFPNNNVISIRDVISLVEFMNTCHDSSDVAYYFFHGVCMVIIDSIGFNSISFSDDSSIRDKCIEKIEIITQSKFPRLSYPISESPDSFNIGHFGIKKGSFESEKHANIFFSAETTLENAHRVLRALQVKKPILLEGSPGVGKTSLIY